MKETTIEDYLTGNVKARGGLCVKFVSPGEAGHPDRLIKLPGKPAALLELKRPGISVLPELQELRRKAWAAVGMLCGMAANHFEVDQFLGRVAAQRCAA